MLYMSLDRRQQAERNVTQDAERLAGLNAVYQEQLVEGTRQLLIVVSQSHDVREGNGAACSAYLRQLLSQFGAMYVSLGVLDRDGALICSGATSPLAGSRSDRSYFKRALETRTFAVGEYVVGRQTRKASLPFAYPLLDEQGNARLVIFAAVDLERFNYGLNHDDWPAEATLIVTDRSHTILAMHLDGRKSMGRDLRNDSVTQRIGPARVGTLDFEEHGDTQVVAFERVDPPETGLMVRVFLSKT